MSTHAQPRTPASAPLIAVRLLVLLTIALAALAVIAPFFVKGDASGHDFEFHVASWMEVAHQWREQVAYPRWAALANFNYGEPRFIFYPPGSWMLGAALSFLLPWGMVPGACFWLLMTLAGACMYRLAREWLPRPDATAAGVLFAVNPYHQVIVFWRSDFAELLAAAIFPLLLWTALRLARQPRRAFLPLALLYAATWLSNAPAGVIASYVLALVLLVLALGERSPKVLLFGGGAMALGIALASFYLVPAAFEQDWVNIREVLSAGLRPKENFLFTLTPDPEHNRFNFLVSKVAVGEMTAFAMALGFGTGLRRASPRTWWTFVALVAACVLLMVPLTMPLWNYLPKLRYVQFPWRWLFPLGVPFAGFVATALARMRGKTPALGWVIAALALAVCGWSLQRHAWWDRDGVEDLREAILVKGVGYEGVDEYAPRGTDPYDLNRNAPRIADARQPERPAAGVHVEHWHAEHRVFTVTAAQPTALVLRLLNYPAWKVKVDGQPSHATSAEGTGQMVISVPVGQTRVTIEFARTADRRLGLLLSVIALAFAVLAAFAIYRAPVREA